MTSQFLIFFFFVERRSPYVFQTDLKLLASSNSPTLAFRSAGIVVLFIYLFLLKHDQVGMQWHDLGSLVYSLWIYQCKTSASLFQAILLLQSPKKLGLQVPAATPG